MKTKLFIFLLFLANTIFAQQITEYKNLYTDNTSFDFPPANPKYYKDINHYFDSFVGTWKYTNGNKTFIVTLWKEAMSEFKDYEDLNVNYYADNIYGHYKMVQDYGTSNQSIIYTSEINMGVSSTQWPTVVFADAVEPNKLAGHLYDIKTEPANSEFFPLRGFISLTINSGSNPVTAHWKVTDSEERLSSGKNYSFVIPTDITLTKE
ncbi:DUF6705 family protein [Chryseobacterium foetidum]|uniref:DUF6705 family protein n=1 Tax=Chryseobacterium foetidum TaxID=2951057 RepID=UPI0021C58DA7|nr:DUF6705 family protein [Chryseobacterium foetidum]